SARQRSLPGCARAPRATTGTRLAIRGTRSPQKAAPVERSRGETPAPSIVSGPGETTYARRLRRRLGREEAVLLHLLPQPHPADAQLLRGAGLVSRGLLESLLDEHPLGLLEVLAKGLALHGRDELGLLARVVGLDLLREVVDGDPLLGE